MIKTGGLAGKSAKCGREVWRPERKKVGYSYSAITRTGPPRIKLINQ